MDLQLHRRRTAEKKVQEAAVGAVEGTIRTGGRGPGGKMVRRKTEPP